MVKTNKFAVLAILGALAVNPAVAEDKSAAMVNGISIPQARVDMRVKAAVAQGQADSPELRKAIRDDMINLEVMVQEATKLGLNKNDDVVQQTELAKQSVLAGAFAQDYMKSHPISEDQLKQEYNKLKAKFGNREYNVRHILVDTEAEAKAIITLLAKKGNNFEKFAADKSKDPDSAAHGGSLGWIVPGNFVPPFANAVLHLKKGERTKEPVQTDFGWHIIAVDDIRDLKVPSFDDLKPQLQQRLQQQSIKKVVDDLRAKTKVE